MSRIETIFSPLLFEGRTLQNDFITVVVDVFRATSCFCTALYHGAKAIIPVTDLEALQQMKNRGYITAAERGGKKVPFADFGNDPNAYITPDIKGKEIAYSTTNGTVAIAKAGESGCKTIAVGSFLNLTALGDFLVQQQKEVLILCAGWQNRFSFEDAFFAGALSEYLMKHGFETTDDATNNAMIAWNAGKTNPIETLELKSSHLKRLLSFGITNTLPFVLQIDAFPVVPILKEGKIVVEPSNKTNG